MKYPHLNPVLHQFGPYAVRWPVHVQLGPFAVRWYALAYVAGILVGWRYAVSMVRDLKLWRGARPTATPLEVDDFVLWVTVGIIAGGRIGYVLFYMLLQEPGTLLHDPLSVFRMWEGGMSFHGGLIGVTLAVILFAWRRGIDLVRLGDLTAPCVPFGLFFGRLANYNNGELWGRPTTLPWGLVFDHAGPLPRHPSQLYEAALEGVALFLALRLVTHGLKLLPRKGAASGTFLLLYGLFRVALENVREPDRGMPGLPFGLTMGMTLSLPLILGGAALLLWSMRPAALAQPAPATGEPLERSATPGATPPEAASDLFPAYESEVAEPFAPSRAD